MFIIEERNPTQTDIVSRLRISAPSVHWHVRRLIAFNMIEEVKEGKHKRYVLCNGNAKYIGEVLKNHNPTIWNRLSSRIAEMFLSLSSE